MVGPDARDRYPEPVHILVTGFEPFGGDDVNPSAELVARLRGEVATAVLPVEFEALRELVPHCWPSTIPRTWCALDCQAALPG